MIKAINIKNFKGFEHLSISDLSRIVLIGGRNNIGKSSLLEAVFLFYDRDNPTSFFRHLGWRGIELTSTDAATLLGPAFYGFQMDRQISIAIQEGIYDGVMEATFRPSSDPVSLDIETGTDERSALVRVNQVPLASYVLEISYKFVGMKEWKKRLVVQNTSTQPEIRLEEVVKDEQPSVVMKPSVYLGTRIRVDPNEDAMRFGRLDIEGGKIDRIVQFLKILEPDLVSLSAVALPSKTIIHADIGLGRKIPITSLGDGMSRLLSIILAIGSTKNGIVLVDDIESGIHYSVLPKLWESIGSTAREFNCQIIATTHSYECLQAAHEGVASAGLAHEFHYVRLDRTQKGIFPKNYSHAILGSALERGWEVR